MQLLKIHLSILVTLIYISSSLKSVVASFEDQNPNEASEYHIKDNRAVLIVRSLDDASIVRCYLYGDRNVIETIRNDSMKYDVRTVDHAHSDRFNSFFDECQQYQRENFDVLQDYIQEYVVNAPDHEMAGPPGSQGSPRSQGPEELRSVLDIFSGIYPGTKWCGKGNISEIKEDGSWELGTYDQTDACCAKHDHCPTSITAGTKDKKTGLHNDRGYTISHCDCDVEFRDCLRAVMNDEYFHALAVGKIFFSFANLECYLYGKQCVKYELQWIFSSKCVKKVKQWHFTSKLTP